MVSLNLERKLRLLIESSLPEVARNPNDLIKFYKDGLDFFYKELVTNNSYIPEKDKVSFDVFADTMFFRWFYMVDKLQTPEIRKLIEENKQKIYDKTKRNFSDFKPKGNALDLVFWYTARDWYHDYLEKQKSLERKEKELERKRQAQLEREAKKQAKKSFVEIKDIFDKGSNDLIWKFLLDYKKKSLEYFKDIKTEYSNLKEPKSFYYSELNSKDSLKAYSLLGNDAKAAYLHQEKKYPTQDIIMALLPDSRLNKYLEDDIDVKYAELVKKIYQKTKGKITNVDLHIVANGNLNGYIYYDGGKIKVETILAWGDIYKPHYRVLVH